MKYLLLLLTVLILSGCKVGYMIEVGGGETKEKASGYYYQSPTHYVR